MVMPRVSLSHQLPKPQGRMALPLPGAYAFLGYCRPAAANIKKTPCGCGLRPDFSIARRIGGTRRLGRLTAKRADANQAILASSDKVRNEANFAEVQS
jgi:hypothetical protein